MKTFNKILLPAFLTTFSSVSLLIASPSDAAILWKKTTGQIQELTTDFWNGERRKTTSFLAFNEEQNISLPQPISLSNPANWDNLSNLPTLNPSVYPYVSSHFIYLWNPSPTNNGRITASATVVFPRRIIGLMGDPSLINPTNNIFAPTATIGLPRFGTLDSTDLITIRGKNNNILDLNFSNYSAMDPLRVITIGKAPAPASLNLLATSRAVGNNATAPEPLTLLGTGAAFCFGAFFKQKLGSKRKKDLSQP